MTSISVGAVLSQTGIYALQGRQALRGLRLWVAQTNAAGGLFVPQAQRHLPLSLLTYDDRSRRAEVERLVERLIVDDRVDCLIGPYSSGLTRAAAAVAEAHQKVLWNHGGSSDAIMRQGFRWSVHLPTPASRYFAGLFDCLLAHGAAPAVVAVVQRLGGTFAAEVTDGVKQAAERRGFSMRPSYAYPDKEAEFPALAAALAEAQPAVLVLIGRYADDVALVRAMVDRPHALTAAAAVAAPLQVFGDELQEGADGWIGPSQWEPGAAESPDVGPTSAVFVERFRQRYGEPPDYPAAQAYAAGLIFQYCLQMARSLGDAELRAAADQIACRTFYGGFRLDPDSGVQVGHEALLVQWQDRRKRVVWPSAMAQGHLHLLSLR
jgi:branched-chain amino acid transport system substrate-binding protein